MAERHAVDRGIVARDVDRDGIDVGRDAPWRRATAPARQRRAGRCRCRCRRCWRSCAPSRSSLSSAARQPAVVACWPVPNARPASISKLIALRIGAGRSACGRRSGRRGSAAARPGSSSPNRPRRAARPAGARCRGRRSSDQVRRRSARARNRRGSASRRAWSRRVRRRRDRRVVAEARTVVERRRPLRPARACRRTRRRASSLGRWLPWPAARRAPASAARRRSCRRCHRAAACPSANRSGMSLADGCGVSRISHGLPAILAIEARKAASIGRMVAEAIAVAADRRQAVGIDDRPAHAAVAAYPAPAERARGVAGRRHCGQHRDRRAGLPRRRGRAPDRHGGEGLERCPPAGRRARRCRCSRTFAAGADVTTVAPLIRCSFAMPPTWSRCSWLVRMKLMSRDAEAERRGCWRR